jgi:hypothetical protein
MAHALVLEAAAADPGLPGVLLIYGGMWLAAWIDGFTRIGPARTRL